MKLDEKIILNVIVAMALWTLLDRLFLGKILDGIGSTFEQSI